MKIITKFNLEDEVYGIAQHRSNGIYINKISIKGRIIRINLERSHEHKRDVYVVHDKHGHGSSFYGKSLFTNKTHAGIECDRLNMEER